MSPANANETNKDIYVVDIENKVATISPEEHGLEPYATLSGRKIPPIQSRLSNGLKRENPASRQSITTPEFRQLPGNPSNSVAFRHARKRDRSQLGLVEMEPQQLEPITVDSDDDNEGSNSLHSQSLKHAFHTARSHILSANDGVEQRGRQKQTSKDTHAVKRTATGTEKPYEGRNASEELVYSSYTSSDDSSVAYDTDYELETSDDDLRDEFEPSDFKARLKDIIQNLVKDGTFSTSIHSTSNLKSTRSIVHGQSLPYIAPALREKLENATESRDWVQALFRRNGTLLHVDFTQSEISFLTAAAARLRWIPNRRRESIPIEEQLQSLVHGIDQQVKEDMKDFGDERAVSLEDTVNDLARHAKPAFCGQRDIEDIVQYLLDVCCQRANTVSSFLSVRTQKSTTRPHSASLRLLRETNAYSCGGKHQIPGAIHTALVEHTYDYFSHVRSWTGGSGDVMSIAWSHTGEYIAAGCSAIVDQNNLSYNCPNNLLYGLHADVRENGLLMGNSDHRLARKSSNQGFNEEALQSLDNSRHQYRWIFQPVSIVKFSAQHNVLFSGSHDKKLMAWNFDDYICHDEAKARSEVLTHKDRESRIKIGDREEIQEWIKPGLSQPCWLQEYDSAVEDLDISQDGSFLAVATHDEGCQVRTYRMEEGCLIGTPIVPYSSKMGLYPSSLKFGTLKPHHLLVGYTAVGDEAKTGDLSIYDVAVGATIEVLPRTQSVFDTAWHPSRLMFAAATVAVPDAKTSVEIKSFVRLWDYSRMNPKQKMMEMDCLASDVNDLRWGYDTMSIAGANIRLDYQVTASCTDGKIYVWDMRRPQDVLYTLAHSCKFTKSLASAYYKAPLVDAPPGIQTEIWDTGVRFTSFHPQSNPFHLYTGASDGIVKKWDLRRSQEDVHIKDVCNVGHQIISGRFSPDGSDLLIGDDTGKLHLYSANSGGYIEDEDARSDVGPELVKGRNNEANEAIIEPEHGAAVEYTFSYL